MGIAYSMIPQEYSALSLVKKNDIDELSRDRIICSVADLINNQAKRWFVMKLRPGVSVEEVKKTIEDILPGRQNSMLVPSGMDQGV